MNSEIRNGFPWIPLLHRVTFYGKFAVCSDAWLDKARSGLEYAEVQRVKRMSRFLVSLICPREFQINLAFEVILNEVEFKKKRRKLRYRILLGKTKKFILLWSLLLLYCLSNWSLFISRFSANRWTGGGNADRFSYRWPRWFPRRRTNSPLSNRRLLQLLQWPCLQLVVRPGRWTKTPYPRRLSAGGWSESFQKPGSPDDQTETLSSTLDGCLVG